MRKYLQLISCVCVLVFASCHSTKKATAHRGKQPRFIDDIYMDRHNKNITSTNAIDKSVKYPEQKHTSKRPAVATKGKGVHNAVKGGADVNMSDNAGIKDKYANMLGVRNKDIDNYQLFKFIDAWYGVDYRLGGSDKDGIDCSGFVQKLYTEVFGVDLVRTSYEQFSSCEHLHKADDAGEGDLVFFKTHGKRISHVGVYLMNDYFVHASTTQGIVISSLKEEYWHKHFAGVGRVAN